MKRIEMKTAYKDEVYKDGCLLSLYNPDTKNSVCVFKAEYKDTLVRCLVFMFAIFIFSLSLIFSLKFAGESFSVVYALISFFPFYLLLVSPFVLHIILKKNNYNRTINFYDMLRNHDYLCLSFFDFSVKLLAGDKVIRDIYYSWIKKIEFYDNVIIFRCYKKKNTFYISSEYKKELLLILKKLGWPSEANMLK